MEIGDKSIVSDIGNIDSIMDLGCGFGYTTAGLKELFPTAIVYGTNIKDTTQYMIASYFARVRSFTIISDTQQINTHIDLIFASEYFEHFERPIEHLLDILHICTPDFLLIANSFNTVSIGHFTTYYHLKQAYTGKQISGLFNDTLRLFRYEKVKTNLWNSRPTYWRKIV